MKNEQNSINVQAGKYIAFGSALVCLFCVLEIVLLKTRFQTYGGFRFLFYAVLAIAVICFILNLNNFRVACPECNSVATVNYPYRHCPKCGNELLAPWKEIDEKGYLLSIKSYIGMAIFFILLVGTLVLQGVYMNKTIASHSTTLKIMDLPKDGTYEGVKINHSKYKSIYVVQADGEYAVNFANDIPVAASYILQASDFKETGIAYRCSEHQNGEALVRMLYTYRDKVAFVEHYDSNHSDSFIKIFLFRWLLSVFGMIFLIYVLMWIYHIILWKRFARTKQAFD